ncbi:MAG: biotin--[acetyl-CoA-carboxylase] ligase [bacterium JZ-2024 1]
MEKPLGRDNTVPITSSKIRLLTFLKQNMGKFIPLTEISEKMEVHRSSLTRDLEYFRKLNYRLETRVKQGVRLVAPADILHPLEYLPYVKTRRYGRYCRYFRVVDSTNRAGKLWAQENAPDGAVVIAEYQSKGYGRFGRKWFSPFGKDILFSLIIYPSLEKKDVPVLPFAVANAVCEALQEACEVNVETLWPNDILLEGKKLGGILIENTFQGQELVYSIVGIGINVNSIPEDYPEGVRERVTSLRGYLKKEVSRPVVFAHILNHLEETIALLEEGERKKILIEWQNRALFLNNKVYILLLDGEMLEGIASGVDVEGKLRVVTKEKSLLLDASDVLRIVPLPP